jgi:tetratricopeptide (TPR) repeat protein
VLANRAGSLENIGEMVLPKRVSATEIARLMARRLGQISAEDRAILRLAALIGRQIDMPLLAAATGQSSLEIGNWVLRCHEASILEVQDLTWFFAQDRLREAVLADTDFTAKRLLHQQIAGALEGLPEVQADLANRAAVLVHHWHLAGNKHKEAEYAALAGEAAANRYANDEAVTFLKRALTINPEILPAMARLGEIQQLMGTWEAAEASFRQGITLAEIQEDAAMQARFAFGLGALDWQRSNFEAALIWLQKAQNGYSLLADSRGLLQVYTVLIYIAVDRADFAQAEAYYAQANQLAISLNDQASAAEMASLLGIIYLDSGRYDKALPALNLWQQLAARLGDKFGLRRACANLAIVYTSRDDLKGALNASVEVVRIANELGDLQYIGRSALMYGAVFAQAGAVETAARWLLYGAQVSIQIGDLKGLGMAIIPFAHMLVIDNQADLAIRVYRQALALCKHTQIYYYWYEALAGIALAYTEQGEAKRALDFCRQSQSMIAARKGRPEIARDMQCLEIYLAHECGEYETSEAKARYADLLKTLTEPRDLTAVHFYLWQITGNLDDGRLAAKNYNRLYQQTHRMLYAKRHLQINGTLPPPIPPLASPSHLPNSEVPIERLIEATLRQVDQAIEDLPAG